jgi:hypothetical protein
MKNFNKLVIVLISLAFVVSGALAQNDASPKIKTQLEKQVKPQSPEIIQQVSGSAESVPTNGELIQQRDMTVLPIPAYAKKTGGGGGPTDSFCSPIYTNGCQFGDGFYDFAVEQIQNMGSGCANLNGVGWSEYYNLGPAILIPGMVYNFTMSVGYSSQHVNIWIDFNNDNLLTANEMILTDYIVAQSGVIYNVPVTIPANATPGAHNMRAMCVWLNAFTDPCGSYSYGEAEDYSVIIGVAAYGTIEGYVTKNTGGTPIQGASISVNNGMYTATSAANGFYQLTNVLVGTWDINCSKTGYNPASSTVIVTENQTTTKNFAMTAPTMNIAPATINVIVDPFGTATELVNINNNGDGGLDWDASLELLTESGKTPWDLQFNFDVTVASGAAGNAGAECDGQYYYTTRWASNLIHKYDLTGALIEEFSIPGVTGLRDLAFDGTYMYGGAAANTIYQMDFVNKTLVSTITSPQAVRSIAYDEGQNGLWVANWDTDIALINMSGGTITSIPATTHGLAGIYGTAYDNWSTGGPFLWIFDQGAGAGSPQILYQADLNSITMTGFTHDVTADLPPNTSAIAGGLFTIPGVYPGTVSLGGLIQGTPDVLFMYELAPFATWITIAPGSGSVPAGGSTQMSVNFDAGDIPAGTVKTANIHFTSDPAVGTYTIPVSMTVGSLQFGHITGTITLGGSLPYNIGDVTEVLVAAGPYSAFPNASGFYDITTYPGTYDVIASLYGYQTQTIANVVVAEGATVSNQNMTLPCLYGKVTGTVTSVTTGLPIPNATVKLLGTDFEDMTGPDGVYEIIVESAAYNLKVNVVGYASQTVPVNINAQQTLTQNFALEDLEGIIVVIDLDPTPTGQALADVVQDFFPGGLVEYTTSITGVPLTEEVQTVFLLLGIYANCFVLTETEANVITTWINAYSDRNLYMEGGDTWAYDTQTSLHSYFNLTGLADGTADLTSIEGIGSYWSGSTWNYSGENNYIDHLEAIAPAINVLKNPTVNYNCAVAYDEGTYKTVGASFEITGMNGGPGFNIGVACVMAWFGYPVFTYGNLEGYVTETAGGAPIQGATIAVGGIATGTSGANGYYFIDQILTGTWLVTCTKEGYNPASANVTIVEDVTSTQNFQLTEPQMVVNPLTVFVELEPNAFTDETVNISNPGNGTVDWSAGITVIGDGGGSDALFDLQFDWPVGNASGEAGIETDGSFIYTTLWNGTQFCKYEMNGTYIGTFSCGSAGAVRDLAYDGTYFYGAAANTTVFQMDFTNSVLVGQFAAPTDIRAIAYNEDDDAFYGNNWDTDITKFNSTGANLGSFPVGPIGASYYGFAYDNYSSGAPFLWGYAQTGNTLNELVQIQLPSGVETGVSFDVGTVAAVGTGIAGGLAITDAIINGFYTLLGTAQNVDIWGLELCESGPVWLTIAPNSGSLPGGQNQDMTLHFNAMDLIPGYYYAEIHFSTNPNVGSPVVDVTLHVEGLIPATNLDLDFDCTDVILSWEITGGTPDSYNVYRDGVLVGNSTVMTFTDPMVDPDVEYGYYIKAVYLGVESQPTATENITVPVPADLEASGLEAVVNVPEENDVTLTWDAPEACLAPDGYNVYRDGDQINATLVTVLTYVDESLVPGLFEYYVTAVYYFGESDESDPIYALITGIENYDDNAFQIFPNPASSQVYVKSPLEITNLKVLSNSGQLVMDKEVNAMYYRIDVSKFESGIYYIKIETADGEILKKITVN